MDGIVDWQSELHGIQGRNACLLESGKYSDCQFLVGTVDNQRLFSAHKLILLKASPVFERMFYDSLAEETYPIAIPDVEPNIFQAVLEYIYSDRIAISSFDEACDLFYAAKKYFIPQLVEECRKLIIQKLSSSNACRGYEFGKMFDESQIIESSLEIISSKTTEGLEDPSFIDANITTVIDIFDQDKLILRSEMDLFIALTKYVSERMKLDHREQVKKPETVDSATQVSDEIEKIMIKTEVSAVQEEQETTVQEENESTQDLAGLNHTVACNRSERKNIDIEYIRKALDKISFDALTLKEFATIARSPLFVQDQALNILLNLISLQP